MEENMLDVVMIGAGVTGCAARQRNCPGMIWGGGSGREGGMCAAEPQGKTAPLSMPSCCDAEPGNLQGRMVCGATG